MEEADDFSFKVMMDHGRQRSRGGGRRIRGDRRGDGRSKAEAMRLLMGIAADVVSALVEEADEFEKTVVATGARMAEAMRLL